MTTLPQLLAAIVEGLGSIEGVKSCEAFGGRFELNALERFGAQAPAIRVAVLRISSIAWADTGEFDATVEIGAFIVTRDEPGKPRDAAALLLAQHVLERAFAERWALPQVQSARPARAENIYSNAVQKNGVALWGVTWTSKVRMGASAYPQSDNELLSIYVGDELVAGGDHE
jgi:hypothetical protein